MQVFLHYYVVLVSIHVKLQGNLQGNALQGISAENEKSSSSKEGFFINLAVETLFEPV